MDLHHVGERYCSNLPRHELSPAPFLLLCCIASLTGSCVSSANSPNITEFRPASDLGRESEGRATCQSAHCESVSAEAAQLLRNRPPDARQASCKRNYGPDGEYGRFLPPSTFVQ